MWSITKKYLLHIEPSTVCNAACPLCPRYVMSSKRVRDDLDLRSISYDQYIKWFPATFIKEQVSRIMLCGNQGDPFAAKDIDKIIKYSIDNLDDTASFIAHSNGGLRDTALWSEIGSYVQGDPYARYVFFSIDGLKDTNHLYRRNVRWEKLIDNAKAYIDAGGNAVWDLLVFKHNEHQIEEIQSYAKSLGFHRVRIKRPDGFYFNNQLHKRGVYDATGNLEYTIEASSISEYANAPVNTPRNNRLPSSLIDLNYKDDTISDYKSYIEFENHCINCKSMHEWGAEVMISSDGLVLPCCYIGEMWTSKRNESARIQLINLFDTDNMHLDKVSFIDIMTYFDNVVVPTWEKNTYADGKLLYCSRFCGQNSQMDRLIV